MRAEVVRVEPMVVGTMMRKIPVEALRLGMYVERLDRHWLEIPTFRRRITNKTQIEQLSVYHVREVYINTAKGSDLEEGAVGVGAISREEARQPPPLPSLDPYPLSQEIAHAERTYDRALSTLRKALDDVLRGEEPNIDPVEEILDEMIHSVVRNRDALSCLLSLRAHNESIYQHCLRVGILSLVFARYVGYGREHTKALGMAALLHDLGEIQIPSLYQRSTLPMNDKQYQILQRHVALGARKLQSKRGFPKLSLMIMLQHHERVDGSGYPNGLKGDAILDLAKILMIADTYDKLTVRDDQDEQLTPHAALAWMREWCGNQLDSQMLEDFQQALGVYPVGSLVKLSNQCLGIVISLHHNAMLMPIVWMAFDAYQREIPQGEMIDLAHQLERGAIRIVAAVNPLKLGIDLPGYIQRHHVMEQIGEQRMMEFGDIEVFPEALTPDPSPPETLTSDASSPETLTSDASSPETLTSDVPPPEVLPMESASLRSSSPSTEVASPLLSGRKQGGD